MLVFSAADASQVIQVVTVDAVGAGCSVPATGTAATVGASAGLSKGAIVAIVGGVAAVGTTVGLAAAGSFDKKPKKSKDKD